MRECMSAGVGDGLQIRSVPLFSGIGGFDSHTLPPKHPYISSAYDFLPPKKPSISSVLSHRLMRTLACMCILGMMNSIPNPFILNEWSVFKYFVVFTAIVPFRYNAKLDVISHSKCFFFNRDGDKYLFLLIKCHL